MIHKRNIEVVCLDCKEMICTNCALFGQHRGHSIYSEDDLLMMLGDRAQDIVHLNRYGSSRRSRPFRSNATRWSANSLTRASRKACARWPISYRPRSDKSSTACECYWKTRKTRYPCVLTKAINQVLEQVQQKTSQWDGWWDANILVTCTIEQAQDWCI